MRAEFTSALQERWAASLRDRAQLAPRLIVPVLDALLTEQWPLSSKIGSQIAPRNGDRLGSSGVRAVVNLSAVVDVEDVDGAGVVLDPVDDPVGAPGSVTAGEGTEQRCADPVRVDRRGGVAELQHGGGGPPREAAARSPAARPPGTGSDTAALGRCSRAGGAAPGQILPDGGKIGTGFAAAQRRQARRDSGDHQGCVDAPCRRGTRCRL